jgi:hypothetical protein
VRQGRDELREPREKGYRTHASQSPSESATEIIANAGASVDTCRRMPLTVCHGYPLKFRQTNAQNLSNAEFESWAMNARALESLKRALRES